MDIEIPGYRLGRQIGKGGMAVVHEAVQENFDRKVAIKILCPGIEAERELAIRFLSEAKLVATLNHPHIIPVYDVGQVDSYYFIAMEHLPGNTLKNWIKTGLEEPEILQITREIAEALHYAHGKGIVHRDIKPDNIMFREDNSAVLTDFGIARSDKSQNNLTQEGTMIGTPAYMSPEQARGLQLDRRSDLYSLGIVFYEMLTRDQPYVAEDPIGVALAQVSEPVPTFPARFSKYQPLLDKMMAKDREKRIKTGLAVSKLIKELEHGGSASSPVSEPAPVSSPAAATAESVPASAQDATVAFAAVEETEIRAVANQNEGAEKGRSLELSLQEKGVFAEEKEEVDLSGRKRFSCEEEEFKKAFFFKSYGLKMELLSEDIAQFNIQFGQLAQKLLDWHDRYGKKAKRLTLEFSCKPWMAEKVEQAVRHMVGTKDPYGFLSGVDIHVVLKDLTGNLIAEHPDF